MCGNSDVDRLWSKESPRHHSIATRLALCVGSLLLVMTGLYAYGYIQVQGRQFVQQAERDGLRLGEVIRRSIGNQMLNHRRGEIQKILEAVGGEEDIRSVRLISKQGIIAASGQPGEIGNRVDRTEQACYVCHRTEEPLAQLPHAQRARILREARGRKLGVLVPIYNETPCFTASCHAHEEEQRVLGVLDIFISLSGIDHQIRRTNVRALAYFGGFSIAILTTVIVLSFVLVREPIKKLIDGTRRIADGDLDIIVPVSGQDEVNQLAHAFNRMAAELKRSKEEILDWNRQLKERINVATAHLRSANEQLRQRDADRLQWLKRVAHDLRAPLAAIHTCLKVAVGDAASGKPEKQQDLIKRAIRRSDTLVDLVRDLEALSYLMSFDIANRRRSTSLNEILRDIQAAMSPLSEESGVHLEIHCALDLPSVYAEGSTLRVALGELVENALLYSKPGGTVQVWATAKDPGVQVEITDTGIGIPAEDLSRVAEEFYRAGNAKAYRRDGTGLGLPIARYILTAHGVNLQIQSRIEQGTQCAFVLPSQLEL